MAIENATKADAAAGEAHVCIQFQNDGVGRDALEDYAFAILEPVERDAAGIALSAVVACDFAAGAIELEFDVAAATGSEIHRLIGQVLDVIESAVPLARESASKTAIQSLAVCA